MRASAVLACALIGCTTPEPILIREPVEVLVEVPIPCKIDIPATEGPDFAASDSNIEWAATYAEGRIIALRQEVTTLRQAVDACQTINGS